MARYGKKLSFTSHYFLQVSQACACPQATSETITFEPINQSVKQLKMIV